MSGNLPPADELFQVREQLKQLKDREEELRLIMFNEPSARTGNRYVAVVKDIKSPRTDIKELRAMHPDLVAEFTHLFTEKRVELREITDDGEVIPVRRRREAVKWPVN